METIDKFKRAKKEHTELELIITDARKDDNSTHIHYANRDDIYSVVAFSFRILHGSSRRYDNSERLSVYIGKACSELKAQIMDKAIELSLVNVGEVAQLAKVDAESVLASLESE